MSTHRESAQLLMFVTVLAFTAAPAARSQEILRPNHTDVFGYEEFPVVKWKLSGDKPVDIQFQLLSEGNLVGRDELNNVSPSVTEHHMQLADFDDYQKALIGTDGKFKLRLIVHDKKTSAQSSKDSEIFTMTRLYKSHNLLAVPGDHPLQSRVAYRCYQCDAMSYIINWGDGTPYITQVKPLPAKELPTKARTVQFEHTYAKPGKYEFTIRSNDLTINREVHRIPYTETTTVVASNTSARASKHGVEQLDESTNSMRSMLSGLNLFALAFYPAPSSETGHTDVCQFNGLGVVPKGVRIKQDRSYRQLAPLPGNKTLYALSTNNEIFRIDVQKGSQATLQQMKPDGMKLVDAQGKAIKTAPGSFAALHGITFDSKRNRVVFCGYSGGKEKLFSFVPGSNIVTLLNVFDRDKSFSHERMCLAYDKTRDHIFAGVGGWQAQQIDEYTPDGDLLSTTNLKQPAQTSAFGISTGLQLFVHGKNAIVFLPPVFDTKKSAKVFVYDLATGEIAFKADLSGLQP